MRNLAFFWIFLALVTAQCRTLRISDFHDKAVKNPPLPRMGLLVHQESFAAAFDRETFTKGWNGNVAGAMGAGPVDYMLLSDLPLEDVFATLGNEVNENLSENKGDRYGHVRFRLMNYYRRAPGWGYMIPSVITASAMNVFGMPYNRYRSELDLQVEVADSNKKILARYRASGMGRAYVAMYYGYRPVDAWRKANLLALQEAMEKIRKQILADRGNLKEQLVEAGRLRK